MCQWHADVAPDTLSFLHVYGMLWVSYVHMYILRSYYSVRMYLIACEHIGWCDVHAIDRFLSIFHYIRREEHTISSQIIQCGPSKNYWNTQGTLIFVLNGKSNSRLSQKL